jgi:hypothetical protein
MLSVSKRIPAAVIGIAVLLCLDVGLVALGWIAASKASLSVDPIAEANWTSPEVDTVSSATEYAGAPEENDPVLARPIFCASRKPFEPPPVQASPPPPRPPPPDPVFVVDGIMLFGDARRAHLRQPQEVDGQWYEAGQIIDGWTIVQIEAAEIVLEQAERKFEMRLYSSEPSAVRMVRRTSRRTAQ